MHKLILLSFSIFIFYCAGSQEIDGHYIKVSDCDEQKIFEKSEVMPSFNPNTDSLKSSLNDIEKILTKIKGTITLNIVVHANGAPCLYSILNKTNGEVDKESLMNFVTKTAGWQPAIQNQKPVAAFAYLQFKIRKGRIVGMINKTR